MISITSRSSWKEGVPTSLCISYQSSCSTYRSCQLLPNNPRHVVCSSSCCIAYSRSCPRDFRRVVLLAMPTTSTAHGIHITPYLRSLPSTTNPSQFNTHPSIHPQNHPQGKNISHHPITTSPKLPTISRPLLHPRTNLLHLPIPHPPHILIQLRISRIQFTMMPTLPNQMHHNIPFKITLQRPSRAKFCRYRHFSPHVHFACCVNYTACARGRPAACVFVEGGGGGVAG